MPRLITVLSVAAMADSSAAGENAAIADKTTVQNRHGLIILLASP
jgi:hypothetical protein